MRGGGGGWYVLIRLPPCKDIENVKKKSTKDHKIIITAVGSFQNDFDRCLEICHREMVA